MRGSSSGFHRGTLRPYSTSNGASFVPAHRFRAGEVVTVRLVTARGHGGFRFRVGRHASIGLAPGHGPPTSSKSAMRFVSRPDLLPPAVTVTARGDGRSPGNIFVAPILSPGTPAPMRGEFGPTMYDDQGQLVWMQPVRKGLEAFNFRVQSYGGAPVLTWWQGLLSRLGLGFGENIVADRSYKTIARVRAGNGYHADIHEFTIDRNGGGWMTIYVPVAATVHGHGHRSHRLSLLDSIVQRVDIATGLVTFEWHSLGHIGLRESYIPAPHTRVAYDPYHVNSIEVGDDGNVLVSERNTWAAYEISAGSGRIMWRLGGKRSDFKLGRGARFAWQHDARRQADGTITVFDDEAAPAVGKESRGIALALDPAHHTAQLVRSYTHTKPLLTGSQGSMQVLPGGNALVGWGAAPFVSEYSAAGQLLFDLRFPAGDESYRAYRFPWTGQPTTPPALAAKVVGGQLTAYASWNGATEVASWRLLAGAAPTALTAVGSAARSGFETALAAPAGSAYLAVQALDARGAVLGTSAAIKAP